MTARQAGRCFWDDRRRRRGDGDPGLSEVGWQGGGGEMRAKMFATCRVAVRQAGRKANDTLISEIDSFQWLIIQVLSNWLLFVLVICF